MLAGKITGSECLGLFSQNKDELIIQFSSKTDNEDFFIRCTLSPSMTWISFPENLQRARKNSIDLFSDLNQLKVLGVVQSKNERAFTIDFENRFSLIFKLFGNRSNILLQSRNEIVEIFHKRMADDFKLKLPLDKDIPYDYDEFQKEPYLHKWFPGLKGLPEKYLQMTGYEDATIEKKWEMIQNLKEDLSDAKSYYLIKLNNSLHLSLIPFGDEIEKFHDVKSACNEFFYRYIKEKSINNAKKQILASMQKELKKSDNYLLNVRKKLQTIRSGNDYKQLGDLLMANLHEIPHHSSKVKLNDFYTGEEVEIKLKSDLSPQKNAENYYRKAKNQYREIETLESNIRAHETRNKVLKVNIETVTSCNSLKELKNLSGRLMKNEMLTTKSTSNPYREREIMGFKVFIGKNARSNDELLRSHTKKDDLWLHVKDAGGSHVIIKHQAGKQYNDDLIERSAQLAAFYSKRKTETLVPVAFTARKYVRKRKGDPPGMVVVEKEKVVLVEPKE